MAKFERLPDPDPNDDEDEDEDEEEEDEDEVRTQGAGVGATPAISIPAAVQASVRKRGVGSSHKGKEIRKRGTIPTDATRPTQADLLWLDILRRNELVSKGIGAEHFSIRVARLDQGQETHLSAIDGSRCAGDGSSEDSASNELMRILVDEIHWHSSRGLPATYALTFTFKRGGGIYEKGKVRLPSNQEIGQMRAAEMGLGRAPGQPQQYGPGLGNGYPPNAPQGYGPQGYGAPPQYGYPPPPYGYPPPHPGFGAAPPAPSTGDEVTDLREQVRSLSEMVRDMWRYGAQQFQPGGHPQGFGAPPQAPAGLPMSAFGEMQQHLSRFGLTIAPAQQPGAAMVPAASGFQTGLGQLKELAVGVTALKEVADALNGVFNQNQGTVVEEPKPEPDFEMVEVGGGATWPNGDPIRYARDDKGLNWFGTVMGNGYAMDKFGTTMAGLGKRIVSQINKEPGVGALADDDEDDEEVEQQQPQPPQRQAVVTPPPANPPPPRMNGARAAPHDDGFSL